MPMVRRCQPRQPEVFSMEALPFEVHPPEWLSAFESWGLRHYNNKESIQDTEWSTNIHFDAHWSSLHNPHNMVAGWIRQPSTPSWATQWVHSHTWESNAERWRQCWPVQQHGLLQEHQDRVRLLSSQPSFIFFAANHNTNNGQQHTDKWKRQNITKTAAST